MYLVYAFLIVAVLAGVLAVVLGVADKKFRIEKDERLVKMEGIMPGANCGGCGFAGCSAYAEAVVNGEAEMGLCSPGGQRVASAMAEIMGVEAKSAEDMKAFVFCRGNCDVSKNKSAYDGVSDCRAAAMLFKGLKGCDFGCLHFGSCIGTCDSGAIYRDSAGNVRVDWKKCIGCGKCAAMCPMKVIRMIPARATYAVACSSKAPGQVVNKTCGAGCIGCGICVKKFPESGCVMDGALSSVDYSKSCAQIAEAAAACPKKIIVKV